MFQCVDLVARRADYSLIYSLPYHEAKYVSRKKSLEKKKVWT